MEYKNVIEFAKFNKRLISHNPFLYFYLDKTLDKILKGEIPVYGCFNIIDKDYFCCGLVIDDACLLYASDSTSDMIPLVVKGLQFEKFNKYHFMGTKNIIDSL